MTRNLKIKTRSRSPKLRPQFPEQQRCCRWILLLLYSFFIYWFGLMSGLFACHHGFDLTAHEVSASLLAASTSGDFEYRMTNSSAGIDAMGFESNMSPAMQLKPEQLKLPTPIIVMGLMKAGTTSIYSYFKCGLDPNFSKLSHYNCNDGTKGLMSCGKRMRRNITKMKTKAFATMDMFTVYAELDGQEKNGGITVPQWQFVKGKVASDISDMSSNIRFANLILSANRCNFCDYSCFVRTPRDS